ncbi:MAG: flagellar FlbD family protein [Negativicutes bacterium]|nr:flagellar FlbD family protein [Negativicutes bacterium]
MIELTKLRTGEKFFLNADLVEMVEATPDTIITLTTGKKIIVQEKMAVVANLVAEYRARLLRVSAAGSG